MNRRDLMKKLALAAGAVPAAAWSSKEAPPLPHPEAEAAIEEWHIGMGYRNHTGFGLVPVKREGTRVKYDPAS
jgi:hypothetical protein